MKSETQLLGGLDASALNAVMLLQLLKFMLLNRNLEVPFMSQPVQKRF